MLRRCRYCGCEFETPYATQLYCSNQCSKRAYYERGYDENRFARESMEPLHVFECKNCGRRVEVYSRFDQRRSYCCGLCAWRHQHVESVMHVCQNCGCEYQPSRRTQKYCSSECQRQARAAKHPKAEQPEIRACEQCGEEYEVKHPSQKYCSSKCQRQAQAAKHPKAERVVEVRACEQCGEEYEVKHPSQKYCSARCRNRATYFAAFRKSLKNSLKKKG